MTRMRKRRGLLTESLERRELLAADPVISEFLASNQSILTDADGETPDWIELHNAGDESVDLAGWYLTDDPTLLDKWQVPVSTQLAPNAYLVVLASDQDRVAEDGTLHTNFKLSAQGDFLALVNPELAIVSQFGAVDADYPAQFEDVSYGLAADGEVGYFLTPTPGEPNAAAIDGFVADTRFSVDRGFYGSPFDVEVTSATPGATLVYTLDGSEPTLNNGTQVTAAAIEAPVASVSITTTTTLRAAAFREGYEPTNVDTQTYLFLDDIIQQPNRPSGFPTGWRDAPAADYEMDPQIVNSARYTEDLLSGLRELASVSLVSDVDGLFGASGIYANPNNDALEIPTSVEWILPNGDTEFQIDAGLKVSGGASRNPGNSPKHSLSLRFRSEYGAGRLNHELFPGSPVDSFNSLQLRAMYNNSWIHWNSGQQHRGTLIRDQFIRDSLLAMGQDDAGRGTYAHLYLNGLYWGVYNVHERPDSAHYAEYHGGSADDYDARNGTNVTDGTATSYNRMRNIVANSQDWSEVEAVLDVENFIDWTIVQSYGGNEDIKLNGNWRAAGGGAADGKWKIYAWDSERILEGVNARPPSQIVDAMQIRDDLLRFPEFVLLFGDRVEKHFQSGGALSAEAVRERWDARADELHNAIVAESARWGDYRRDVHRRGNDIELYARDSHWLPEIERLRDEYFPNRSDFVYQQFQNVGWLPDVSPPDFEVNGVLQHGGEIEPEDLIGFTVAGEQVTVTESSVLIDRGAPVRAHVPVDGSLETGNGPLWYDVDFDDANWIAGTNGVGYENSSNGAYRNLLGTDVGDDWNANRSSLYTRFEFTLDENKDDFDRLLLRMTFDDGFAAYLNGIAIDVDPNGNRNLAPTQPRWNSLSVGDDRPDNVVLSGPVEFDITGAGMGLLRQGRNVLAIHGLSQSPGSSDMLMRPELALEKTSSVLPDIYFTVDGTDPRGNDGAIVGAPFLDPFALDRSTIVRARTLVGNEWSAMLEAEFLVDQVIGDINGDGQVSFADFLILSGNFGKQATDEVLAGDLDEDGLVGFADFLILSANFGNGGR